MKKAVAGITLAAFAIAAVAVAAPKSGLKAGEGIAPFHPTHITGPMAGSDKCFPCTFQNRPQIMVFVNGDSSDNVAKIAKQLEKAVDANKSKELKAMIVMIAPKSEWAGMKPKIEAKAKANKLNDIAIAMLEPTHEAIKDYKINTGKDVKNTVFFYRNWKVARTEVNLKADSKGMSAMTAGVSSILN